jgi:LSD1 subclass zinc finger protein
VTPAGESPLVNSLRCPQCGGENPLPSGARLLRCAFCDAALFVDRGGLVSHYALPRLLDRAQAAEALRRWMAGNETVKDLDQRATLEAPEPLSFPMWLFRVGGGRGEEVRVEPAAPTPIPQLVDLEVPAGKLEPYRREEAVEETAATVPLATARGWLGERAQRTTETALVHLPLWRCRYAYGGQSYTALVDASTGAVLASVYPAKAETPYYLTAALGLLLFLVLGFAISNPFVKLVAYAITGIPLALIAYWVTRTV